MLTHIALFASSLLLSQVATTPSDLAPSVAPLIDRVKLSVVTIQSTKVIPRVAHEEPFGQFFRERMGFRQAPARREMQRGLGSGFITNRSGVVLTNNHVVAGADEVWVLLSDGRRLESRVVGSDPATDVAVVRINQPPNDLRPVVLGNSDVVRVGDYVLAIGNPLGLGQTVTMGIVSAKNRNLGGKIVQYEDFLQTDAAINQGNSGGPLFNFKGEVVGINSAILNPAMAMNVGFAIPINLARQIAEQIEKTGGVARGYLGVGTEDLTPIKARRLGLQSDFGALVNMVTPLSPAAQAGISPNDVILEVAGRQVESSSALQRIIQSRAPGEIVDIVILRGPRKISLKLRLKENVAMLGTRVLGMQLEPISESEAAELGGPGYKVANIDRRSPASGYLQVGDILTHVIFGAGQPKAASPVALKQLEQRLSQGVGGRIVFLRDGYRLVLTLD
jgi:Do/DeqQ family serine protease